MEHVVLPRAADEASWTIVDEETSSAVSGLSDILLDDAAFKIQAAFRDHRASRCPAATEQHAAPRAQQVLSGGSIYLVGVLVAFLAMTMSFRSVYTPPMLLLAAPTPVRAPAVPYVPLALPLGDEATVDEKGVVQLTGYPAAEKEASSLGAMLGLGLVLAALMSLLDLCRLGRERPRSSKQQRARCQPRVRAALRLNASGRPIYDDGRFMPYAEARRLGWEPAPSSERGRASAAPPPTTGVHRWNAFQRCVSACGLSMEQKSALYSKLKAASPADPASCLQASAVSWNGFQRTAGGCRLSRAQMSELYGRVGGRVRSRVRERRWEEART